MFCFVCFGLVISNPRAFFDGAAQYVSSLHESLGFPIKMPCPCNGCRHLWSYEPPAVFDHLILHGLLKNYGQSNIQHDSDEIMENCDTYRMYTAINDEYMGPPPKPTKPSITELVKDGELPLYKDCPSTKMSATIVFYKFKARHSITDTAYNELLEMVHGLLPPNNKFPTSLQSTKKLLKAFDLGYKKIHACPNDCCLYRKELKKATTCPKCGISRWKINKLTSEIMKDIPAKVLRYFPIIPRLRRMFRDIEKAEQLRWHNTHKSTDGKMRHPVDSLAWKKVDSKWPSFAEEPRNIRLGLSSDGFNPFGDLSSQYSCWPVLLVNYNLPPSICMSKENMMLTLLIPGPKQPGNDIDVYLQPLIDDLKKLWIEGVETYDAFTKSNFNLKAVLMWTINDFPAYGNLSGYSTKGKKACPVCGVQTSSEWLPNGHKHCYMCHRRFLVPGHSLRLKKAWFNGSEEHRLRPRKLTGSEVFSVVKNIENDWGKKGICASGSREKKPTSSGNTKRKRIKPAKKKSSVSEFDDDLNEDDTDDPLKPSKRWKKKSVFFELPYWEVRVT